jgi:hypothetical protein
VQDYSFDLRGATLGRDARSLGFDLNGRFYVEAVGIEFVR